ncbi:uncharacterized protein AB675_6972 [Cyphellophora attinorum]|uniref:Alpha/beta hydrolase fold-3 domain-containing protein n=1 Tax=Cyphellophora attinorum TaxID=1664694 RepID=A0A0N1H8S6_9EURO|nr:uncharacterized protein AB675_6972 [Phialophora attinorum]KPI43577.1 hypothetical protein AB675_6972 [Phialophora attinorum]
MAGLYTDELPPPTPPRTPRRDISPRPPSTSSSRPSSTHSKDPSLLQASTSVFAQSFGTTWRKALVSLPRIVPSSLTSRYISPQGPRPFVLKLPPSPPNKYNIPVHIFLVLPDDHHGGETMPVPEDGDRPSAASAVAAAEDRRGRRFPSPLRGHRHRPRKASLNVTKDEKGQQTQRHTESRDEDPDLYDDATPLDQQFDHRLNISGRKPFSSMVNLTVPDHYPASPPSPGQRSSSVDKPRPVSMDMQRPSQRPPPSPLPTTSSPVAQRWQRHKRKVLNLPVLIDFHGGSFILGSPSEQASFCAQMARTLGATNGCVVLSVDYRLGPYSKFPAANEDAEDVVRAVLNPDSMSGRVLREDIRRHVSDMRRTEWIELDTSRLAFSGFSSGGNLALNLVLSSPNDPTLGNGRDWPCVIPQDHPTPIPVLLFYPSLDARLLPDERPRPSGLEPPTGFFASLKIESELMPKYLPKAQRAHPRASPGLAPASQIHPQARMLLVLPELDSLSQQSQTWVAKMRHEGRGADLEVVEVKGEMHGWTQFPDPWLKTEESKRRKYECFERAEGWVGGWWWIGREGKEQGEHAWDEGRRREEGRVDDTLFRRVG